MTIHNELGASPLGQDDSLSPLSAASGQPSFIVWIGSVDQTQSLYVHGAESHEENGLLYTRGHISISGATKAHLIGTFNVWEEFTRQVFINGNDPARNNFGPDWGPATNHLAGIYHVYNPLKAYTNGVVQALTTTHNAYIISFGVLLRAETLDGNIDPSSITIKDTSGFNNHGYTVNLPEWVDGPHS